MFVYFCIFLTFLYFGIRCTVTEDKYSNVSVTKVWQVTHFYSRRYAFIIVFVQAKILSPLCFLLKLSV